MLNKLIEYQLERLKIGWSGYTKDGKHYIVPCGSKRRCKKRGKECAEYYDGDCGRVLNCREKAILHFGLVRGFKNKPYRWRQIVKLYEQQYRKLQQPFKQEAKNVK